MMQTPVILKTGATLPELWAYKGDFEDWILSGMGLDRRQALVVDVTQGQPLPAYDRLSGVVITGSHAMLTEHLPWSEAVAAWLPAAVRRRIPILGICYGHQLLAYALGGQVDYNPGGLEVGTVEVRLAPQAQDDPLLSGLGSSLQLHVSHAQSVLRLPPEAVLLAASDMDAHQAFRVGGCAWGVQFHPEFDAHITRTYALDDAPALRQAGRNPAPILAACRDTPYGEMILQRFASLLVTPPG